MTMRKEFDSEWPILSNAFIFEIMYSMTGKHPKKQEVNQNEIHTIYKNAQSKPIDKQH